MSPFYYGLLAVGFGIGLGLLTYYLARVAPNRPPVQPAENIITTGIPQLHSLNDAVLLVEVGGRVLYSNNVAKELFGYHDEELNLERLLGLVDPQDTFLGLCFSEGMGRFVLDGRLIEGYSYFVPLLGKGNSNWADTNSAMLVCLRYPKLTNPDTHGAQVSDQALEIISDFSLKISSNLDINFVIQDVLESVGSLISSDSLQIFLFDQTREEFESYRLVGLPGTKKNLEKTLENVPYNKGISGYLVRTKKPILISDLKENKDLLPNEQPAKPGFRSFLGNPIIFKEKLVGTFELASASPDHFTNNDLNLLKIFSNQAAVAINNAIRYMEEQKRGVELSSLVNISTAVKYFLDFEDLFEQLVETISGLIQVKVLGFLIYNENHHYLKAQTPFRGIPPELLDLYRVEIPPGSEIEKSIFNGVMIEVKTPNEDKILKLLDFDGIALASGIQSMLLFPLRTAEHFLGYLQVADRLDGLPFDQDDINILNVLSQQISELIEKALFVKDAQIRTQRAETLQKFASLAVSRASMDEIISQINCELVQIVPADSGMIFLLDQYIGDLRIHKPSLVNMDQDTNFLLDRINLISDNFRETVTSGLNTILLSGIHTIDDLPSLYQSMFLEFGANSAVVVPLVIRGQGVGEIHLLGRESNQFDEEDLTLLKLSAEQISNVIEKSAIHGQTDESLRRRVVQLIALNRISRELNSTLELQRILSVVYDLGVETTEADCGVILLFDPNSDFNRSPIINFCVGDSDYHSLTPLELRVLRSGDPFIVNDYLSPDLNSPDTMPIPPHIEVRSSLIVPIAYQGSVAGLIHLHAHTENRFDQTSQEIALSLAVQSAIAIGNAQRFQDQQQRSEMLNRRVETMSALLETSKFLQAGRPLKDTLETISYGIQASTPFDIVLISVLDPNSGLLRREAGVGIPLENLDNLMQVTLEWDLVKPLFLSEYKLGNAYLIPQDVGSDLPAELKIGQLSPLVSQPQANQDSTWRPNDFLLYPILGSDESPLGMIRVFAPRNDLKPDQTALDTLELFAGQTRLILETHQSIRRLSIETTHIEQEMSRIKDQLEIMEKQNLDSQLHEQLQMRTQENLNRRLRWKSAAMDVADKVDLLKDRTEILDVLCHHVLENMDFENVLMGELVDGGTRLINLLGDISEGVTPQALLGQSNPLRTSLQTGKAIFLPDLDSDPDWSNSPLLKALDAKAFVCQPLVHYSSEASNSNSGIIDCALLAISKKPLINFELEDAEIFALISKQVTTSLHNVRIFKETNKRLQEMDLLLEFSRKLGVLDSNSILKELIESVMKVIPSAEAAMAALWSGDQKLLNPKVALGYVDNEKILQIPYFSGISIPGKVFSEGNPINIAEVDFAQEYDLLPEHLLLYRDATQGKLPVSCLAVPLQTFDEQIGVLVFDNFRISSAFTEEDQALVLALAHQTALTLQNVRLYQASEARAAQLLALTEVASTITSSLQSKDLINTLLVQVRSVVPFDTGIFWLRDGDHMTVRAANGFTDIEERIGLSVALEDSLLLREMAEKNEPISVGDVRKDDRFPALMEHQYLSWLGVPLLSKNIVVGVIVLEKTEAEFFNSDHIQAMVTFAGQASVALENSKLYEDSVSRAEELNERSKRLAMLNRLSTELSGSMDLDRILRIMVNEILNVLLGTQISVALMDDSGRMELCLQAPKQVVDLPELLPESPVFDHLKEGLGVFLTEDISKEPELDPLVEFMSQMSTVSLLIIPLVSGQNLLGLSFVHSKESDRFSPEEVSLASTISNQVAVAIQNARLFRETERLMSETRQTSAELATLFDLGVEFTQILEQNRLLEITFINVSRLIDLDTIVVTIVENEEQLVDHILDHGQRKDPRKIQRRGTSFSEYVIDTNESLLIHDTQSENKPVDGHLVGDPSRCWLGVPLIMRGKTNGVISVQSDTANAFGKPQLHLLRQIANQLSVALDNAHLFQTVQNYTQELEQRVSERTEQVEREHRRIQTLLAITTELSASLDLDIVLNRTLGILNDTIDAGQSSILLLQPDSQDLFLRASLGYTGFVSQAGQKAKIKQNEGLAGWVLRNRQSVLVNDLHQDARWEKRQDRTSLHRSAMAVPLVVGEETLGVIMVFHQTPGFFESDQLDLVQAIAKQIAIALNNTQLYGLIRDQAERLGNMLRTQHVETSRSQAILEAVADGVLVTDSIRKITLFNASAENILGLSRKDVVDQSLEKFIGLFGNAAKSWVRTIRKWSEDPESIVTGDTYEAQIELDNRRVVSVHLSPVQLHSDFLGTVSIFRDITHQVEVDRLKSEFVATVSHELRTPMTSIKGYVEILLMGAAGELKPQQAHFLDVVKGNTERLAVLVNDLLDVSRIEAGKVILSLQPVDLGMLVNEIVDMITRRMASENRNISIEKNIHADVPLVRGDPARIKQILGNLVENAYQYTPSEGHIWITLTPQDSEVKVDIRDDGIGIKPEESARVFERFYRGEDPLVLASSGTGLGLSIVQTLIQMHNGRIWFESEGIPGRGSIFSFTIPVYDSPFLLQNEEEIVIDAFGFDEDELVDTESEGNFILKSDTDASDRFEKDNDDNSWIMK